MRYEMHLNKQPFNQIVDGRKAIEVRLNDSKRKILNIGDEILFISRESEDKTVLKTIVDLRLYPSFAEMANNEDCVACGFDKGYSAQEVVDCYHTFYTVEEEQKFGVLAIELN